MELVKDQLLWRVGVMAIGQVTMFLLGWLQASHWFLLPVLGSLLFCLLGFGGQTHEVKTGGELEQEEARERHGERLEWLNRTVGQVWCRAGPSFASPLSSALRESACPAVYLERLDLGQVAPKIETILETGEGKMEGVLSYQGDCCLSLGLPLPSPLPHLTASLRNLCIEARVSVEFGPVPNSTPSPSLLPGISICLTSRPMVDFELGGVATLLDLPGVSHLVRQLLADHLHQALLQPVSLLVPQPLVAPSGLPSARDPSLPSGVLCLTLVEAHRLANKDLAFLGQGQSDPYAVLEVTIDSHLYRFRTPTIRNSLEPVWDFLVQIPVEDPDTTSDISVSVLDQDKFTRDGTLGQATLSRSVISRAKEHGEVDFWSSLEQTNSGRIRVRVSWSPLSRTPSFSRKDQALVMVTLDSCESLSYSGDWVVSLSLGSITKVSSTGHSTTNPIFQERFLLFSVDPTSDKLRLDVIDMTSDSVYGTLYVPLSNFLNTDTLSIEEKSFPLMDRQGPGPGQENVATVKMSLVIRYLLHSQNVLRSRARCRAKHEGRVRGRSEKKEERVNRIWSKCMETDLDGKEGSSQEILSQGNLGEEGGDTDGQTHSQMEERENIDTTGPRDTQFNNERVDNEQKYRGEGVADRDRDRERGVVGVEVGGERRKKKGRGGGGGVVRGGCGGRAVRGGGVEDTIRRQSSPQPMAIRDERERERLRRRRKTEELGHVIGSGGGSYLTRTLLEWEQQYNGTGSCDLRNAMEDLSNNRVRARRDTIGNWKLGSAASLGGNGSSSSMWSSVGGHGGTQQRDAPLTNGSGRSQSLPRSMSGELSRKQNKYRLGPTAGKKDIRPKIHLTVKFNPTTSVVSVIIHRIINLHQSTQSYLHNPYVKIYLIEVQYSTNMRDIYSKKKTKTKKQTVNPVFEDTLEYYIPQYNLQNYKIEVNVCSRKNLVSRTLSLGRCLISLGGLEKSQSRTDWLLLRPSGFASTMSGDCVTTTRLQPRVPSSPSSSRRGSYRRCSLPAT